MIESQMDPPPTHLQKSSFFVGFDLGIERKTLSLVNYHLWESQLKQRESNTNTILSLFLVIQIIFITLWLIIKIIGRNFLWCPITNISHQISVGKSNLNHSISKENKLKIPSLLEKIKLMTYNSFVIMQLPFFLAIMFSEKTNFIWKLFLKILKTCLTEFLLKI